MTVSDIHNVSQFGFDPALIVAVQSSSEAGQPTTFMLADKQARSVQLSKRIDPEVFKKLDLIWMPSTSPGSDLGLRSAAVSLIEHDDQITVFDRTGMGHLLPVDVEHFYTAMAEHMERFEVQARNISLHENIDTRHHHDADTKRLVQISLPHEPGTHHSNVTLTGKKITWTRAALSHSDFKKPGMVWMKNSLSPDHNTILNLGNLKQFMHEPGEQDPLMVFDSEGLSTHLYVNLPEFYTAMAPYMQGFHLMAHAKWDPMRPRYGVSTSKQNLTF